MQSGLEKKHSRLLRERRFAVTIRVGRSARRAMTWNKDSLAISAVGM
jgi:hypothetical protein